MSLTAIPTTTISAAIEVTGKVYPCFFGLSPTSVCNPEYIITNSFSLGEAVAAFGLALAVFQLKNHQWDIVLNIRVSSKFINSTPWYLCFLGGLSILWAVLLPFTPWLGKPVLGYPVVFEILGAILLVLPPTLLWLLSRPSSGLFNPKNAKRFSETIQRQSTKFTPENIDFCIQLVYLNLEPIVNAIQKYVSEASAQNEEVRETCGQAELILDTLLSNKMIVSRIATTRLDFIDSLVTLASSKKMTFDLASAIGPIVNSLYNNPDSYFYTQVERYDYKYGPNAYHLFFNDPNILAIEPFAVWSAEDRKTLNDLLQKDYLRVYLKTLELGIAVYFAHTPRMGDYRVFYRAFGSFPGYSGLIGYLNNLGSHWMEYKNNTYLGDLVTEKIQEVESFLSYTVPNLLEEAFITGQIQPDEYNHLDKDNYHKNPIGAYVGAVYNFIIFLANHEKVGIGSLRARELIRKMLPDTPTQTSPLITKMGELLKTLIWENIEESVTRGIYPPIIKVYIGLFAYRYTPAGAPTPYSLEQDKVINFMYTRLKPEIIANALMSNGKEKKETVFLPKNVRFNRTTEKFELLDYHGQASVIEEKSPAKPPTITS